MEKNLYSEANIRPRHALVDNMIPPHPFPPCSTHPPQVLQSPPAVHEFRAPTCPAPEGGALPHRLVEGEGYTALLPHRLVLSHRFTFSSHSNLRRRSVPPASSTCQSRNNDFPSDSKPALVSRKDWRVSTEGRWDRSSSSANRDSAWMRSMTDRKFCSRVVEELVVLLMLEEGACWYCWLGAYWL